MLQAEYGLSKDAFMSLTRASRSTSSSGHYKVKARETLAAVRGHSQMGILVIRSRYSEHLIILCEAQKHPGGKYKFL